MDVVYGGNLQLWRHKDHQSGLAVGVRYLQATEHSVTSKLRAIVYFSLKATEDETIQRRSHIAVVFWWGNARQEKNKLRDSVRNQRRHGILLDSQRRRILD